MSVYIKGIGMPTSCDNCWALDDYGDYPRCRITDEQRGYKFPIREKRMGNCPLVPVPPHGRLIDADALKKIVASSEHMDAGIFDGKMLYSDHLCVGADYEDVCKAIDETPTIIPADDSKLSATIKCGGAVTCAVAYSEEVYDKYVDTAGNLRWTGTHSGEHIIPTEEGE